MSSPKLHSTFSLKTTILKTIYSQFALWSATWQFACRPGCSTCCTTKVTVTALEGRRILEYCYTNGKMNWLVDKLAIDDSLHPPVLTTNEFIAASLNGREEVQEPQHSESACPFLESGICAIYEVRPFSCRCFASTRPCHEHQSGIVSDDYFYGSTATLQLIEHLGQFDFWGNLTDILLLETLKNEDSSLLIHHGRKELLAQLRPRLRRARPIPGFILPKASEKRVSSLLNSIFASRIGQSTVEDIFNGKGGSDADADTELFQQ